MTSKGLILPFLTNSLKESPFSAAKVMPNMGIWDHYRTVFTSAVFFS
jgi:hypothetical protein